MENKSFSCLINGDGQFYSLTIQIENRRITFNDSLKMIPFSVADIAKSFKMDVRKGEIDYNLIREYGHELTDEELDYLKRDVKIVGDALYRFLEKGYTKITAGSNALKFYTDLVGKSFEKNFPVLPKETDSFIRKSYRGGWTYAAKNYRSKTVGCGRVYDVNSMYPYMMYSKSFPVGLPHYFEGKYKPNKKYSLYIQRIECSFVLKKNRLPTIQLKSGRFGVAEFAESSEGEIVELTLTNVDLKLFMEQYKVSDLTYLDGYSFSAAKGMFNEYIDYWINVKVESEKNNDYAMRAIAKLFLNSLYGKFAKRPEVRRKHPYLVDGVVNYKLGELEEVESVYLPVGTFVTSYARDYIIRSAQKNYKRFLYADTDSLHILDDTDVKGMNVDKYELGAWKHEGTFIRARYIGAKCYIEEMQEKIDKLIEILEDDPDMIGNVDLINGTIIKVTASGLPHKMHSFVNFANFKIGMELKGKLRPKHVKNGIKMEETTFRILQR